MDNPHLSVNCWTFDYWFYLLGSAAVNILVQIFVRTPDFDSCRYYQFLLVLAVLVRVTKSETHTYYKQSVSNMNKKNRCKSIQV